MSKISLKVVEDFFKINKINEKYLVIIKKYNLWLWTLDSLRELLIATEAEYYSTGFCDFDTYNLRRAAEILIDLREDKT